MKLGIDTANKIITIYDKINIYELIDTFIDLNIKSKEWSIAPEVKEQPLVEGTPFIPFIPANGTPSPTWSSTTNTVQHMPSTYFDKNPFVGYTNLADYPQVGYKVFTDDSITDEESKEIKEFITKFCKDLGLSTEE